MTHVCHALHSLFTETEESTFSNKIETVIQKQVAIRLNNNNNNKKCAFLLSETRDTKNLGCTIQERVK
jgi:hypothetical protein